MNPASSNAVRHALRTTSFTRSRNSASLPATYRKKHTKIENKEFMILLKYKGIKHSHYTWLPAASHLSQKRHWAIWIHKKDMSLIGQIINNHWVIPENIHTYTTGGSLEFQGRGGLHCLEFWSMQGNTVWNSKGLGVSAMDFQGAWQQQGFCLKSLICSLF